jgi:CheY-like chemotaxis protein
MSLILVVDDHVDTCLAMMKLLRSYGHAAECVHDGEDALSFVAADRPDLVLMDVSMPGLDGITTLQRLRGMPDAQEIPVVMLSAMVDADTRRRAMHAGAVNYVVKSDVNYQESHRLIGAWIAKR